MFIQLCSAIEHCHANNVLLGNIKPENVLLKKGPTNKMKIVCGDFGVIKQVRQQIQPDDSIEIDSELYQMKLES